MSAPVVLIHGAWHGGWCWQGVVDELAALGVDAAAPDLPLTSLADDVAVARSLIEKAGPGAVVVGHSYGGQVISLAARDTGAAHLVYVAALMLDEDQSPFEVIGEHGTELMAALVHGADGLTIDPVRAVDVFYADSTPEVAAAAAARLRPMGTGGGPEIGGRPAWKDIPSTYLVCTEDRAIPAHAQRDLAARASHVVEWPTDHSPFLTRPADLAHLIVSAGER